MTPAWTSGDQDPGLLLRRQNPDHSRQSTVFGLVYCANGNRFSSSSAGLVEQYGFNFYDQETSYTRLIPQSRGKDRTNLTAADAYNGVVYLPGLSSNAER